MPKELHCRRFVWRFDHWEPWKIYGIKIIHFGDRPTAIGLEVVKPLVATDAEHIDPKVAKMITQHTNQILDNPLKSQHYCNVSSLKIYKFKVPKLWIYAKSSFEHFRM